MKKIKRPASRFQHQGRIEQSEVPNALTQAYSVRVMGEIPSDIADRVSALHAHAITLVAHGNGGQDD
jgi:hypothetical protein